jgi:predicted ATPase
VVSRGVRIAFSGTHRAGKTSLLDAVAEQLPDHVVVDEPYRVLEDEGHDFSDPPTADDFMRQLQRSIELLADAGPRALFDRCPVDFIAYLRAMGEDSDGDDLDAIRDAMATLDLVVLVPLEAPDRIVVASPDDRWLRREVDDAIQTLLLDDPLGLGVEVVEVRGDLDARVRQVLRTGGRSRSQ